MTIGNIMTEYTRREREADEAVIREAALIRNAVLRRALAIAACEHVRLRGSQAAALPDAGVAVMLTWVMRASEELEKEQGAFVERD